MPPEARRFHRIGITYANVTATVALFLSLGGASYAAFSLPPHSVGPRELRAGAVGVAALGFPLGATSVRNSTRQFLTKNPCNSPPRPGEPPLACPLIRVGGPSPTQLRVAMRSRGHLLVSVIAGMDSTGAADTYAEVTYAVILDGRPVSASAIRLPGGQLQQAPIQVLVSAAGGSHTVGLQASAHYLSNEPGEVIVDPVSLVALSLP
ncbi:MAG: hypothetical protein ABSG95_15310 [Solirubrobacteraceae bacterium]|jgi:hypothetical protein